MIKKSTYYKSMQKQLQPKHRLGYLGIDAKLELKIPTGNLKINSLMFLITLKIHRKHEN
jgi:hypothetical protein